MHDLENNTRNSWTNKLRRLKWRLYYAVPFRNCPVNLLKHGLFTNRYIPKVIYLEVTNRCNARCFMCPNQKMKRGRGDMPWDVFQKIVDECVKFEGRGLHFILHKDGEPLMDKLLFERIDYLKKTMKKSTVHFNTNAMLLDDEKASKILNSPLDSITFSVDGASASTYEKIRAGLKYEVVVDNINRFFEKKKMQNSHLHVTMQMVVDNDNISEVEKYRELWQDKANRVFIKEMHNFLVQNTSMHQEGLSAKQIRRCHMPFMVMLFYWNGDVGLCCWDYDNLVGLGNIHENSLLEIFNNEKIQYIRNAMIKMDCKQIKPCNICSQIYGLDGPPWQ